MERISKDDYYLGIAIEVSKRSTCLKRHYGCVIVKNDEIIATGYNGSARGEKNCCDVFVECPRKDIAHNTGDYSDCPAVHAEQNAMLSASRKDMIGATMYLAGEEQENLCMFAHDSEACTCDCGPWCSGYHLKLIDDATPCPICTRMIKNAGIVKVINLRGEVCLQ